MCAGYQCPLLALWFFKRGSTALVSVATSMYHIRYMCRFAVDEFAMSLMPFSSLICPRSHFQDMLHQSDIRKLKQNSKP